MYDTIRRTRQLAEEKGISPYELCKRSGVAYSTFANAAARNGQLRIDTIELFAAGLGISLAEFFAQEAT